MRWDDLRESTNIEDVRASTGAGGPGLRFGVGGTLLALVGAYFFGIDPRLILGLMSQVPSQGAAPSAQVGTPHDEQGRFIAAVLGETEDAWSAVFQAQGLTYTPPTLVLYRNRMPSACGSANSAAVANLPPPSPSVPAKSVSQNWHTASARSRSRPLHKLQPAKRQKTAGRPA